jgi:hypothetical protein
MATLLHHEPRVCAECGHEVPWLGERILERLIYAETHICHVEFADRWSFFPEECGCSAHCHH